MPENNTPDAAREQKKTAGKWWCNFCNFRSDNEQEYLNHSCTDELEKTKAAAKAEHAGAAERG